MDLKALPGSNKGHKYILCIKDEVTNYLIVILIHQPRSEEMGGCHHREHNYKILYAQLYNNGSRQHIHVFSHELFI